VKWLASARVAGEHRAVTVTTTHTEHGDREEALRGDTDLVVYSLRKHLRLAVKGNPTALLPLYAPAADLLVLTPPGSQLRELAPRLVSRLAVPRFLGYLDGQRRWSW
jgi:uncharacterized protein